jgi:hypothetical protein
METVLVHELAHVTQAYRWLPWLRAPMYWHEGIADYVRFKLGYTNVLGCPQCSVEFPHYTSGFWCAGAFLLYLDTTYGPTVVRRLSTDLRHGRYSEKVFVETTGKTLDELLIEFQGTPAFTPVAAAVNKLYTALGYSNGKAPRDVETRFRAYLQRNGEATNLPPAIGQMIGEPPKDVLRRYAVYRYLNGERGPLEAAGALIELLKRGELPGFLIGEKGQLNFGLTEECHGATYPLSHNFSARKIGDVSSTYHYTVTKGAKDGPWQVQRAWRTVADGMVVEEYRTAGTP